MRYRLFWLSILFDVSLILLGAFGMFPLVWRMIAICLGIIGAALDTSMFLFDERCSCFPQDYKPSCCEEDDDPLLDTRDLDEGDR
jgi:hypothetical protein